MFQLILKNMRKKKIQTFAVLFSVTVSVAVLFALALVHDGVAGGIALSKERLGADLVMVPVEAATALDDDDLLFAGTAANYYMDESAVDEVQDIDGVKRASAQFFCQTLIGSACCTDGLQARIVGFDFETDWTIKPWMQTPLDRPLDEGEIVVGASIVATEGDDIINVLGKSFTIVSRLDVTGTSLDYSIMMDIDQARRLAYEKSEYAYLWDSYGAPDHLVTAVLVEVDEGIDLDAVATIAGYRTSSVVVKANRAISDVQGQMDSVMTLMLGAALLLGLASLIQLFSRFYTMTWDRRSEFGLYRALGAKRSFLRNLVVGEMLLLVVGGSAIGLIAGYFLYGGVVGTLAQTASFPFADPSISVMALYAAALLILMVAIGLAAVAIPVRQLGKISPTLAMHRGNID